MIRYFQKLVHFISILNFFFVIFVKSNWMINIYIVHVFEYAIGYFRLKLLYEQNYRFCILKFHNFISN